MPADNWRTRPARNRSLCEMTSASAGSSRRVGMKYRDQRIDLAFSPSSDNLGNLLGLICWVNITLLSKHHSAKVSEHANCDRQRSCRLRREGALKGAPFRSRSGV